MNPPEVTENALSQLQAVLNMQPNADQSMIFNLASAIAMQSLLNMNQNNPLLASAAKLMLNMGSLLPANQEEAGSSGANPLSTLQSTLLLQQYAAMARQGTNQANPQLASLHMSLKRNSEPTPRKRSLPLDPAEEIRCKLMPLDDTGRVPMSKEDFDDCLDTVLREELGEESDEPKEDSPLASQSSVTTDDDVKELSEVDSPPKELSLRDILDFNWSESSDIASAVSAFRKVRSEPGQVSHHGSVDSVDWATSISPAGNSPAPEPELAPLSSEMLERIRLVAQSMLRRQGDQEPLSLGDQMERMPSIWRGKIVIKNSTEVAVQMHMMCGEKDYVTGALGPLAAGMRTKSGGEPSLRILQRMRAEGQALYSLLLRLQTSGSTCLCVPIGNSKEEMKQHSMLLKQAFSDYFVRKGCAGIVSVDATETTPASLLYVFPPNEFTDAYLAECSPQLLSKLKNKESEDFCYLFVAIAPAVLPQQD